MRINNTAHFQYHNFIVYSCLFVHYLFLCIILGEQHGAPDVGAAAGPGPRPGEGDDGQDGHLVPLR